MNINYLTLSHAQRVAKVCTLQLMRVDVLKSSVKARHAKPRKEKKKKMTFFSDEIERMFNAMPEEMQDYIRKGGK